MTLLDKLDAWHREVPGCREVVFGDMQAGTVLWARGDSDLLQEAHDARLEEAAMCLGPLAEALLGPLLGSAGISPPAEALLLQADTACQFMRLDETSGDVICITTSVASPEAPIPLASRQVLLADE